MKTKNIFKALAFALLLTTACNKNEIANDENIAEKGYELPVTINVTRQEDAPASKATYNDGTKKLSFSAGDKLFVNGNDAGVGGAGKFAGTLNWVSEGTFSGTIITENVYSGTIDALFTAGSAEATLLPAGYGTYGFLTINDDGTYSASLLYTYENTFAPSKALAIEQFSDECGAYTSGTGFVLTPDHAILNFTINDLSASTEVPVLFNDGDYVIPGNVTTDGSGTATFAIGVYIIEDTDLNSCTLTVAGHAITLVTTSKPLYKGKIYNITRSVPAASKALSAVTSTELGWRIGNDGNAYSATGVLPTGVTAVAKICYVGSETGESVFNFNHGLALALSDAGHDYDCQYLWRTSETDAGHTKQEDSTFESESGLQYNSTHNTDEYPAFQAAIANNGTAAPAGCSAWFLASAYQWTKMINAVGGSDKLGLLANEWYWSSSENNAQKAWNFCTNNDPWDTYTKESGEYVRSCLAF